jgi:K+-sensing histidine kinase KdpD
LDRLLKIGEGGATACREAPIFDKYSDSDDESEPFSGSHLGLTITSTLLEGHGAL